MQIEVIDRYKSKFCCVAFFIKVELTKSELCLPSTKLVDIVINFFLFLFLVYYLSQAFSKCVVENFLTIIRKERLKTQDLVVWQTAYAILNIVHVFWSASIKKKEKQNWNTKHNNFKLGKQSSQTYWVSNMNCRLYPGNKLTARIQTPRTT